MHHIVIRSPRRFSESARQGFHRRARFERPAVQRVKRFAIIDQGSRPISLRPEAKGIMINLTPVASTKVKEIMTMQNPSPAALRVANVGGGCWGFQYHMVLKTQTSQ